jgi:non-ribosomal peptide synthetase component F
MIQHSAVSTSAHAWAEGTGLSSSCRMLQFLSYAFDASIGEIFFPLVRGGTVCIPSEEERLDNIGGAISDLGCNWALITPSFARTIPPQYLTEFEALSQGGEEVTRNDIIDRFAYIPRLITTYIPIIS